MSHLIVNINRIQNDGVLHDKEQLRLFMEHICQKFGYNVLNRFIHEFSPHGITLLFCLAESHISIHTYPEMGKLCFDLYTCRSHDDLASIKTDLCSMLQGEIEQFVFLSR